MVVEGCHRAKAASNTVIFKIQEWCWLWFKTKKLGTAAVVVSKELSDDRAGLRTLHVSPRVTHHLIAVPER